MISSFILLWCVVMVLYIGMFILSWILLLGCGCCCGCGMLLVCIGCMWILLGKEVLV